MGVVSGPIPAPDKVWALPVSAFPEYRPNAARARQLLQEAGAGLTGPAGDAEALAQNVLALRQLSPSQRRDMGLRGRAYFERHFEREMLLDRLEELMRRVAAG
jgi:glycosyltransferase involved in cell wall biosynthesis